MMNASEKYHKISKEAATKCTAARAVATQAYSRNLKPYSDALNATWGTPDHEAASRAYTQAMIRLGGRCEAALNKAERAYALLMKQAWEKYIVGK